MFKGWVWGKKCCGQTPLRATESLNKYNKNKDGTLSDKPTTYQHDRERKIIQNYTLRNNNYNGYDNIISSNIWDNDSYKCKKRLQRKNRTT